MKVVQYIAGQMQQASTWRGIILGIPAAVMLKKSGFDPSVATQYVDNLIPLAMLGSGVIGALTPDSWKPKDPPSQ